LRNVQEKIKQTAEIKTKNKGKSQHIFDMMKKYNEQYTQTLIEGEESGHCTGIKKRMDPALKYRMQQQLVKYHLQREEHLMKIQKNK
jgi:hypothetical protein